MLRLAHTDRIEEAGLLGKAPLPEELRSALGIIDAEDEEVAGIQADEEYIGVGLFEE